MATDSEYVARGATEWLRISAGRDRRTPGKKRAAAGEDGREEWVNIRGVLV